MLFGPNASKSSDDVALFYPATAFPHEHLTWSSNPSPISEKDFKLRLSPTNTFQAALRAMSAEQRRLSLSCQPNSSDESCSTW